MSLSVCSLRGCVLNKANSKELIIIADHRKKMPYH